MIVSDATALIVLFDLERVDLLENLFEKIYLPEAVHRELTFQGAPELSDHFEIVAPKESELLATLKHLLDPGESEAIALAKERNLPLIIDEKKGRKIARSLDLKIIGLLGVIYLNVKRGHLDRKEAEEFIESAMDHGYRISSALVEEMLQSL